MNNFQTENSFLFFLRLISYSGLISLYNQIHLCKISIKIKFVNILFLLSLLNFYSALIVNKTESFFELISYTFLFI